MTDYLVGWMEVERPRHGGLFVAMCHEDARFQEVSPSLLVHL